MIKWIATILIGIVALTYLGSVTYYDSGGTQALAILGLFVVAFGMTLALSLMERPGRRGRHDLSKTNMHFK
jgi:hypothetical protein